jgi:hypothetical protein
VQRQGVGVRGKRVVVSYEEEATIGVLHLGEVTKCAEVVAQMQLSGGADSAQYCFHNWYSFVFIFVKFSAKLENLLGKS